MFKKNPDNEQGKQPGNQERRRYIRIKKNLIMTYSEKSKPEEKIEITQLKNISLGGLCFITTRKLEKSTQLCIDLKTPFMTETTFLEGIVLESHEKTKGLIYETRLQFVHINVEAKMLITQLMEYFINGEKEQNPKD